ncbi:MAG: hypothetical protein JO323_25640 [Acidobacteriia bacterium]|nr:hypothetical protein [Terriglobia bacterium]
MHSARRLEAVVGGLLLGVLSGGPAFAQQVISAQSGTVHYVEGTVYAGGQLVQHKFGQFPSLHQGEELRTEDGRAEMLLTPGAFLRLSENSSVRLTSARLSDTRLDVLKGSVMLECDELLKNNSLTLLYQGNTVQLLKHGLYRLDTEPPQLRVFEGEALVQSAAGQVKLGGGKETGLNGVLASEHFNRNASKDSLYFWSSRRSGDLAYASVTASQSVLNNGSTWRTGGWMWSSLLDEYTFLPGAGLAYSPFGWQYWSPDLMAYYYTPPYYGGTSGSSLAAKSGSNTTTGRPTRPSNGTAPVPQPGATRTGPGFGNASGGGFAGGAASGGVASGGGAASAGAHAGRR